MPVSAFETYVLRTSPASNLRCPSSGFVMGRPRHHIPSQGDSALRMPIKTASSPTLGGQNITFWSTATAVRVSLK